MMFSYSPPLVMQLVTQVPNAAYGFARLNKGFQTAIGRVRRSNSTDYDWHTEADLTTNGLAGGLNGGLSSLNDQSGNGRHLSGGDQPSIGTAGTVLKSGNRCVAQFAGQTKTDGGANNNLGVGAGSVPLTVAVVFADLTSNDRAVWFLGIWSTNNCVYLYNHNTGTNWECASVSAAALFTKTEAINTGRHQVVFRKGLNDAGAHLWSCRQNGAECAMHDNIPGGLNLTTGGPALGGAIGIGVSCTAKFATWIIWNTKLVGQELADLEAFLAAQRNS